MTKTVRLVPVGDESVRHHVTIRDVESTGPDISTRQFAFLNDLVVNGIYNNLMHCGPLPFQTFRMFHDGRSWVVEMEALEEAR